MSFALATVPPPRSIHPETLGSGRHLLQVEVQGEPPMLALYCPRHRVGAMYYTGLHYWQTFVPIGFGDFLRILARAGVVVPESDDARDWIEACGLAVIPSGTRAH